MYYALPSGCSPYAWHGYSYYGCGGHYYEPRYEGDTVVYVTIADPSGGKGTPQGGPTPGGSAPTSKSPRPSSPSGNAPAEPAPTAPSSPSPTA
jgi:hypothetical protein